MKWLAAIFTGFSLALIYFNVGPEWLQYLCFAVSVAFFLLVLLDSAPFSKSRFLLLRKKGGLFFIIALIFVLCIISRRYEIPFDLSQNKVYSLRNQTIEWLKKIDIPIEIMIFVRHDDKTFSFAHWLQEQVSQHTSFVTVKIKNINEEVNLAQRYGINRTGQTVLVSGDNWTKVDDFKEATLLPGIMRLLTKTHASLCFSVGHGEPDLNDQSENGFWKLHEFMTKVGYKIVSVSLAESDVNKIEKTCGVFFLVSPRTKFQSQEEETLLKLAENKITPLVLAVDLPYPEVVPQLLKKEGLSLSSNVVVYEKNLEKKIPKTDIILYPSQASTLLTRLRNKIYLPEVLALNTVSSDGKISWQPLLTTPSEEDYQLMGEKEVRHFYLGFYGSVGEKPMRVVIGTGKALLSKNIDFGDNTNLVLSAVGWLLEEQNMTWVMELNSDEVYMELGETENFWIKNMSIYGLPLLAFMTLFAYWFQRRLRS